MTNFADGGATTQSTTDKRAHFLAFLAEHGVTETRGLEIMRRLHRATHAY